MMQRILIVGSGGAGKSTLSRRLSEILDIEVIHLDSLFWKPGWIESDPAEWQKTLESIMSRDSWIIDGNYSRTLPKRLEACDTVVFLDLPRIVCLWGALKRVVRHYGRTRPDMPEGCPERFDFEFLRWIWNFPGATRQEVLALLDTHRENRTVFQLRSRRDIANFLSDAAERL